MARAETRERGEGIGQDTQGVSWPLWWLFALFFERVAADGVSEVRQWRGMACRLSAWALQEK